MATVLKFPIFTSMKMKEVVSGEERSFCSLGSKLPMMMKKVKISLKCSSRASAIISTTTNVPPPDAPEERLAAAEEPPSFFNSFIEGVLKNLYLPEHSDVIKYDHWKHLAECSLRVLFPGPYDLKLFPENPVEKGIEEDYYYEFLHDDERIGKIIMMEKQFSYTLDDKEIESMKYYHVIQKKKEQLNC